MMMRRRRRRAHPQRPAYHHGGTEGLPSKGLEVAELLQVVDPRLLHREAPLLGVVQRLALLHVVGDGLLQLFFSHVPQQSGGHKVVDAPRLPATTRRRAAVRQLKCIRHLQM